MGLKLMRMKFASFTRYMVLRGRIMCNTRRWLRPRSGFWPRTGVGFTVRLKVLRRIKSEGFPPRSKVYFMFFLKIAHKIAVLIYNRVYYTSNFRGSISSYHPSLALTKDSRLCTHTLGYRWFRIDFSKKCERDQEYVRNFLNHCSI